jgi:hypothetical protein
MQKTLEYNPQLWRLRAREAGEHAEQMSDSPSRRILLIIAESYKQLAERASERLNDSIQKPRSQALDELVQGLPRLDVWQTEPAGNRGIRLPRTMSNKRRRAPIGRRLVQGSAKAMSAQGL